jgi:tetratricopeptide (TPR) repeat protein
MNSESMKPGRNDPCPCASGEKYKHCCGVLSVAVLPPEKLALSEIGALVALIEQNRLTEAEHRARTLLRTFPTVGMLWKVISVALLRQGKDALHALRRTAELMWYDAEAHGNLGMALHDRGLWPEALASLQRALAIKPHEVEVLVAAANAMKALGRAREAVLLYQRALEQSPQLLEAHNNLGNAFLALGQIDDAAGCYRRALAIKPQDAQVQCNLGNALRLLGRLDEAIASSRQALVLDPTLSIAHNNLGLSLATSGQPKEAVASFRQALLLNPRDVEAQNNLGNVLRDLGERRDALAVYRRAIELDPQRAEGHCNLGNVQLEFGRINDAAVSFRRAVALQPRYAPAHMSLAAALRLQHRTIDAEASCQAALAIDPNLVEALCLLGELHADRGQFAAAEEIFQRAVAINPDFAFAFFSIAKHRKMTRDDIAWLKGAEALIAKPLLLGHEICLRYALGKYFDDVGQYDDAFGHYRQANELTKRFGSQYDPAKLTARVDLIINTFDAAFLRQRRAETSPSELPVLIVGMPRSGTLLTEQILAVHPDVFGAGELNFWQTAFTAYEAAGAGSAVAADLIPGMARDYLDQLTERSGAAPRAVDKMPANFLYLGLIHAAFPRARIIHMQRHPIDTCLSIYFQNFIDMGQHANDLAALAHYYSEYVRSMNHWRAVLPATALLEISYEALIADQEGITRRMLEFIGVPWNAKCMDFHQEDRSIITASKWQVRQKIDAASTGRWKNYERFLGPLRRLTDLPAASYEKTLGSSES